MNVFRLGHLNSRESSRKGIFLNTRKPEMRYRMIKFNEVGQVEGFTANIFEPYEIRPLGEAHGYNFNTINLMTFAMLFEPYHPRKSENREDNTDQGVYEEELIRARRKLIAFQNNTKMAVRSRPACVTVPYIIAANDSEDYYYAFSYNMCLTVSKMNC